MNEVGRKVDILVIWSINGILIWKVNDVEKRIEDVHTGKILSLHNPHHYMGIDCLWLYLDSDGQGKGTHQSLFLVTMKSDSMMISCHGLSHKRLLCPTAQHYYDWHVCMSY